MTVTWPAPFEGLLDALRIPQEAAGAPEDEKVTGSPATGVELLSTVTVTVDVEAPLAGRVEGLADTKMVVGVTRLVWSMVTEPL